MAETLQKRRLSPREAALAYGVEETEMKRLCTSAKIPATQSGTHWRIHVDDLDAYFKQKAAEETEERRRAILPPAARRAA